MHSSRLSSARQVAKGKSATYVLTGDEVTLSVTRNYDKYDPQNFLVTAGALHNGPLRRPSAARAAFLGCGLLMKRRGGFTRTADGLARKRVCLDQPFAVRPAVYSQLVSQNGNPS